MSPYLRELTVINWASRGGESPTRTLQWYICVSEKGNEPCKIKRQIHMQKEAIISLNDLPRSRLWTQSLFSIINTSPSLSTPSIYHSTAAESSLLFTSSATTAKARRCHSSRHNHSQGLSHNIVNPAERPAPKGSANRLTCRSSSMGIQQWTDSSCPGSSYWHQQSDQQSDQPARSKSQSKNQLSPCIIMSDNFIVIFFTFDILHIFSRNSSWLGIHNEKYRVRKARVAKPGDQLNLKHLGMSFQAWMSGC